MSTYAVFGMSRTRAVEAARKSVKTWERRDGKVYDFSESEWDERVQAEADKTMDSARTVQISDKFDAPQFAIEFLEIAKREGARRLHIKAYAPTGELHPVTKKPVMAWHDVSTEPTKLRA